MMITDYGNSYIVWTGSHNPEDDRVPGHMPWDNTVRILLDSRCWITNEDTKETTVYNLISPCRTEWMYRDDVLWQQPNREYSGIFSEKETLSGHISAEPHQQFGGDWREVKLTAGGYKRYEFVIRHHRSAYRLENDAETVKATMDYLPIIAHTELWSPDEKLRATIEYPIRTMNVALDHGRIQVDTGPVIYPDLITNTQREIERLHWAFVCYNRDDVAEFVLRGPTTLKSNSGDIGTYIDYSQVRRTPMKNSFYAVNV